MFEGNELPAGDELGLELGLAGGLGLASQAGEDIEDDLGLELRAEGEGPAEGLGEGLRLLGGQPLNHASGPIPGAYFTTKLDRTSGRNHCRSCGFGGSGARRCYARPRCCRGGTTVPGT